MLIWAIVLFFAVIPFPVFVWKKNWKVFILSTLPFIYAVLSVHLDCNESYNSEACVWGYLKYLYAVVGGGAFYLVITLVQIVAARYKKDSSK
jgi:hypothetical protein